MTRARDLAAFVSNADGDVKFDTDTLFIDSSTNRVGIGLTNPTGSLHISNSAPSFYMTDTTNNTEGVVSMDNAGSLILNADLNNEASSSNIRFAVDGTEAIRIDSDGNVGIGVNDPDADLDISGGSNKLGILRVTQRASGAAAYGLDIGLDPTLGDPVFSRIVNDTVTESFRIQRSSGKVGIGDTSPDRHLHVNSGNTNECAKFESTDTEVTLEFTDTTGTSKIKSRADFRFETGSTPTERMRIDSNGAVVVNNSGGDAQIYLGGTGGTNRMYLARSGADSLLWNVSNGAMKFGTNNAEGMRIYSTGAKDFGAHTSGSAGFNIYAGAASTGDFAARFDGVGTGASNAVQFVNGYGQVGSITLSGAATAYNTSSDYRLKENIGDVTDGITRLKQLKPKRFSWIAEEKNEATVDGFLAHEAHTVVPEAVTGTKDAMTEEVLYVDGDEIPEGKKVGDVKTASTIKPQGIDQSKLVPLLAAALQEAIAKIETLETKVAALEAE